MGDPEVVLERSGSIARVILNRPEGRNALGVRTLPALNGAPDAIEADRDIGVVVLTRRGPVFCGGGDLEYEAYLQSFAFRSDDHTRRLAAFRGQRRAKPE